MVSEEATPVNGYAQTLGRGLRVLEVLRGHVNGLGVLEISTALGLNRTVVYRLLGTLRVHGLVAQDENGRFLLAGGLLALAAGVRADLRAIARPPLAALADEVSATAFLTVIEGGEAISVGVMPPRSGRLHVSYHVGMRHPLTVGAAGLAILAGRAPQPGERPEVTEARVRGYVVTSGELEAGAWGLAAPVPRGAPAIGSIGVAAMAPLDIDRTVEAVRRTAQDISRALGYGDQIAR